MADDRVALPSATCRLLSAVFSSLPSAVQGFCAVRRLQQEVVNDGIELLVQPGTHPTLDLYP